jgi:hypothetical protein
MEVDRKQKEELLRKVSNLVEQKYFDPEFDVPKWRSLVSARTPAILNGGGAAEFASVITSKPAIRYHFKTGQRKPTRTRVSYNAPSFLVQCFL